MARPRKDKDRHYVHFFLDKELHRFLKEEKQRSEFSSMSAILNHYLVHGLQSAEDPEIAARFQEAVTNIDEILEDR